MRFKNTITVELNQVDAAIAAVLLAERAGTAAFNALLSDETAEIGGTTNRGERALADSYLRGGNAHGRRHAGISCGLRSEPGRIMKVAHVAVYLDAEQAKLIRWDAQEAVLAADEDLELTQKLHDVNARRLAREAISAKRDIYQEIVDKAQEACEKLNNGEYEYVDDVD